MKLEEEANKIFMKQLEKYIEDFEKSQKIWNELFPKIKVKHYEIKRLCNKIFRTHFTLWIPDPNAKPVKILGVTKPTIKDGEDLDEI